MPQHCFLQRYPSRIVMRPLDLRTQLGIGDRPQGGNTLVRAEGQVETGRAPLAARVLCEFAPAAWGEAVVQPVEVAAVDLAAVGKTEQALRIEPDAVGFLTRRVVLVGMTERALALQVISGRCRLGQGGYHDASLVTTLPDRDTTCPECSWIMTVVALMIPALGIQCIFRGLPKWPCDIYKSGRNFVTFIEIKAPRCRGVRSNKRHFSLVRDRAYAYRSRLQGIF